MATRQSLFPAPRQSLHPSARQSYAPGALRQSLQVPSSDFLASLEDCVAGTEACVSRLGATNTAFAPGIKDLPRVKRVFDHNVVSVCGARSAKRAALSASSAELEPGKRKLVDPRASTTKQGERVN